MANGLRAILALIGKVDSGNALVVTGDATASTSGGVGSIGALVGKVDSSNRLVVKFV